MRLCTRLVSLLRRGAWRILAVPPRNAPQLGPKVLLMCWFQGFCNEIYLQRATLRPTARSTFNEVCFERICLQRDLLSTRCQWALQRDLLMVVPEEDRGTRAGGKSQFKVVTLLIFTHSFSLDIYPPLVGVDLRLRTLCREIAGQHADTQNSCFSNGNPYSILLRI